MIGPQIAGSGRFLFRQVAVTTYDGFDESQRSETTHAEAFFMHAHADISSETIGRPIEILLVEDSVVAARIAIKALENGGIAHRMTWLSDGDSAEKFLRRNGRFVRAPIPDLILLDLTLPGTSGQDLLKIVRSEESIRHVPVVVVSSSDDAQTRETAERLGIESFVHKPFEIGALLAIVHQINDRRNLVSSRRDAHPVEHSS